MNMNMGQKILLIVGGAFAAIGAVLTVVFGSVGMVFLPMRAFLALPLFFVILGICFIAAVLIVHYFDKNQIEREAVIPTAFEKGSGAYPIGMTMDIYEYQGRYGFDPGSVRDEILPGEQELMDDKPVDPSKLRMTAVQCPNCGASYQAAAGYTGRCPYCGSYHDVE